ncbi:MAG: hypothetical protein R3Y24_03825 [Eubacteriales bacterium]
MKEEQRKTILLFQLTSDIFFSKVLEDIEACEEVTNIITEKEFKIKEVKSQYSIRQLASHSVVLDILAIEEMATRIHLEMHPQNNEDHMKRIRYNSACVDVEILEKSKEYKGLSDVHGIYISKKRFGGTKKGISKIKRVFENTNSELKDLKGQVLLNEVEAPNGTYEYYVNLNGKCDTWEQTELLKYMINSDGVLEHKAFPNLVKRVRFLKEEQGGIEIMCEILERERKIGETLNRIKIIKKQLQKQSGIDEIADLLDVENTFVLKVKALLKQFPMLTNEELVGKLI